MTDGPITRYDLDLMENRMVKDPFGGEWIRYTDYIVENSRLQDENIALRNEVDRLQTKCEERRLQVVAAEAGEDALAEFVRGTYAGDPQTAEKRRTALAAYEARRG